MVILGGQGAGKSSMILRTLDIAYDLFGGEGVYLLRFASLTKDTSTHQRLLRSLCSQLYDILHMDNHILHCSFTQLVNAFFALLNQLSKGTRRWVIAVDDIDRLPISGSGANDVEWLTRKLPHKVHIIVSCDVQYFNSETMSSVKKALNKKDCLISIPSLNKEQVDNMAKSLMTWKKRRLTADQMTSLVTSVMKQPSPLLLRLSCDIAARWRSDHVMNGWQPNSTLPAMVGCLLEETERKYGKKLVTKMGTYLCAALQGLTDGEMSRLLLRGMAGKSGGGKDQQRSTLMTDYYQHRWLQVKLHLGR